MIHSDRGVQYACHKFKRKFWRNHLWQSMGRKGDCFDNAVVESFFGILKTEIDSTTKMSADEVRLNLFDYSEIFYNRKKLHSRISL